MFDSPAVALVQAKWVAGYEAVLPDGTVLQPGDTYELPEDEAKASDNWQPAKNDKPRKDAD